MSMSFKLRPLIWFSLSLLVGPLAVLSGQDNPPADNPYSLIGEAGVQDVLNVKTWDPKYLVEHAWSFYAEVKHRYKLSHYELVVNHGLSLTQPIAGSANGQVDLGLRLYEAYLLLKPIDGVDLYVGQKRLNFGVGQTVTVGDSFNPRLGFFDTKTGPRDLVVNLSPTQAWGLSFGLQFDPWLNNQFNDWTDSVTSGFQTSLLLDRLQVVAGLSANAATTFNPSVGLSYDLGGVILTAEGAAEFLPQLKYLSGTSWVAPTGWTDPRASGSAGARYSYNSDDFSLTVGLEYLYNGQGWTANENSALDNFTAAGRTTIYKSNLQSRNYLFPKFVLGVEDWAGLTSAAYYSLDDQSVLLNEVLTYTPWEGLDLVLTGRFAFGSDTAEWARLPYTNSSRAQFTLQSRINF